MRAIYGFLSLLAVVLLIAVLFKKQLNLLSDPGSSSGGQTTQAATLKIQQERIKQSVEASMNQKRSVEESP